MHRTTLVLEDSLLRAVKKLAVDRSTTFRAIVHEALRSYIRRATGHATVDKRPFKFKTYALGRLKTPLDRKRIYEDVE